MRTIRTKIYKFEELSEDAQQKAINKHREVMDNDFIYDDTHKVVEAFNDVFETKEGRNSWLDVYTDHMEENILELKGLRLQKYLWNNYKNQLFKGKYYSLWSKKDISYKYHKNGYPVLKSRYSKVLKQNSCVLTGMCYDDDMLQPIYDFLEKRNFSNCTITFYHLINDCFDELRKTVENEIDYRNTDDAIIEEIKANDYEFTENGNIF
jgi:hypothetical protein